MSAVRMVAYGVLEMKHKEKPNYGWEDDLEQIRKDDFERDQLRKLVNDELGRYGLLMQRSIQPKGDRWRTRANSHVLYGQVVQSASGGGFLSRPVLHEGEFKECCEVAARLLDQLDAAQIPDTATGLD